MITSPQFGHRNATPRSQGVIGLLQLLQIGTTVFSSMLIFGSVAATIHPETAFLTAYTIKLIFIEEHV